MDSNVEKLLNYAGISALVGAGGVGAYALSKYLHDNSIIVGGQEGRLDSMENRVSLPGSKKLKSLVQARIEAEQPEIEAVYLDANELPEIKGNNKQALFSELVGSAIDYLKNPYISGVATPITAVAPALVTYMLGTRLIDARRKKIMADKIDQAKNEFEEILSADMSPLQEEVDALYKSSDFRSLHPVPEGAVLLEAAPVKHTPWVEPAYGVGFSPKSLAYTAGLAPGIGALLGWYLMNNRMEGDPERQKAKQLQNMLKRDVALDAFSGGIDISDTDSGRLKYTL